MQVQYEPIVQSHCRLDLVQRHLRSDLDATEQQVQRHQAPEECLSPLMPAAKLQVAVDPFWSTGAQLRLHQRQLRKTGQSNGRMVSALTHDSHRVCGQCMAPERISKWGGGTHPAQSAGKFFLVVPLHFFGLKVQLVFLVSAFLMVSTVSCLLFFCSRCPVPYGVGTTVCGSDKSLTLTALTRLFGSGLPRTSVFCFNPYPHFLKTHRICINLKTGLGASWGGGQLPPFAPPVTMLMKLKLEQMLKRATFHPRGLYGRRCPKQ